MLPKTQKNKETEMNNILEGINSRIIEAEEQINDLENRMVEITAKEENIEKRMRRNEDSLRDLWDSIKCTNIHIIGVLEGEQREKGPKEYLKIAEKILNMGKEIFNQVQEAQRVPGRINPRGNTQRHIVIKLTKIKDRQNLKTIRENDNIQENSLKAIS